MSISSPLKSLLLLAGFLSTLSTQAFAQSTTPHLPNKGVTIGAPIALGAASNLSNADCPSCGTVFNYAVCSGGRSWNGSSCYCPTGTWNGLICVPPPPPPLSCNAVNASSLSGPTLINRYFFAASIFGSTGIVAHGYSQWGVFGVQASKITRGPTLSNFIYATASCNNGTLSVNWDPVFNVSSGGFESFYVPY